MSGRLVAALALALAGQAANAQQQAPDSRDALIEDLQRRIEALERERAATAPSGAPAPDPRDALIEGLQQRIDALERQRAATAPTDVPAPEESVRALERTLSREGALVLRKGSYEIEPRLEYTQRGSRGLDIFDIGGTAQIARQDLRQERLDTSLALRAGIRPRLQAEMRVPYVLVREDRAIGEQLPTTSRAHGAGDVELVLTRQLSEGGADRLAALVSLLARLPTGEFRLSQPSPGRGFYTLQPQLTIAKREDPVVLLASLSYAWTPPRRHEGHDINPGNALGLKMSALLAASPKTSLRAGFELSRASRTSVDGLRIPGSDTSTASLQVGLATLLSARALLDVQFSAGLTPDSPQYAVSAAVPFRFQ